MALFNKKPKLPSYVGADLNALLQDPQWSYPISQAGIDPSKCEVVLRLSDATIGLGLAAGGTVNGAPAILFGQGTTLAMAYPTEREVKVQRRDTSRAELQTQRSGSFQILFGPANNLDGFMFWGGTDNLQLGTPEGEKFGQVMSAFLKGQLKPQQVVGTPQSLVASAVSVEPPAPEFADPQDELRWKLVSSTQGALTAMMDKYQECFEHAESIERAYGLSTVGHPISQEHFRKYATKLEEEFPALLAQLREATTTAAGRWNDLLFLFPSDDTAQQFVKLGQWCTVNGVPSETLSSVVGTSMFIHTDFGLTRQSFWTENERVSSVMNRSGQ